MRVLPPSPPGSGPHQTLAVGLTMPSTIMAILAVWAVAGPAIMFGSMRMREAIVVAGARKAERNEQVSICNEQRLEIAREINRTAALSVAGVRRALDEVTPTPVVPDEILALCKASSSCDDRGRLP